MNYSEEVIEKVAQGLYQAAVERKAIRIYREELKFLVWNLKGNEIYFNFLKSPFVDYKDKCASLDDVFSKVFVAEFIEFLKILITRDLFQYIDNIRKAYNRLADAEANVLEGKIYSAYFLKPEQISKICSAFSKKLGKTIVLKEVNDPSLIAGIKVILGGTVYEYNVDTRLEEVKENLIKKVCDEGGSI